MALPRIRCRRSKARRGLGAAPEPAPVPASRPPHKVYVVGTPVGRYRESLWEIADAHLGDGRRYREILDLNRDRVQPGGSRLTISSLLRPGWVLAMPGDAAGPGVQAVAPPPGAPARLS
jgi:nucleoid-associated protein YgaU